jgi:hypothetical protein
MTNGRKPSDDQIPDLVIDPRAPKPSRRIAAQHTPSLQSFDLELEGISQHKTDGAAPHSSRSVPAQHTPNLESFDLELEGISQQQQATDQDDFEELTDRASGNLELSVAPRSRQAPARSAQQWPSAVTPDPTSICISQEQLQQVTLVGEPPAHLFETPLYAWLVYRNQTRLKRQVAGARLALETTELERDSALASWTETLRAQLLADQRFARVLEPWLAEEARFQQAKSGLDQSETAVAHHQQTFGDAEDQLRSVLAEATQRCTVECEHFADAERTLGREQAKRKRIDIESRAAVSAALDSGTLNVRIADADRAVQAAAEQLEQRRQTLATARQAREAAELEVRRLEDRKQLAQRKSAQATEDARRNVDATERSLLRKKADVGRALLALRDSKYVDPPTIERLLQHDAAVLSSATQYQCLVRAEDGFDRQAVKRGLILALGTIGLLLLTLLRIIF